MRTGLLACLLPILAALSGGEDVLKVDPSFKVGQTFRHSVRISLVVSGTDAEVTSVVRRTVKSVGDEGVEFDGAFEKLKVVLGDTEFPIEPEPVVLKVRPSGELRSITGGVIAIDMARLYVAHSLILPKTEVKTGEKWTLEVAASKESGTPAYTYEGAYVGPEKVGDKDAFKVTASITEKGGEGLSSKATFWLDRTATVLKFEAEIRGLPIPQIGSNVDAKMSGALVP